MTLFSRGRSPEAELKKAASFWLARRGCESRASWLRAAASRGCEKGAAARARRRARRARARRAPPRLSSAASLPAGEAPGLSPPASTASCFDERLARLAAAPPGALERRSGAPPARAPREGSAPASKAPRGQPASNYFSYPLFPGQKIFDDSKNDLVASAGLLGGVRWLRSAPALSSR